MVRERKFRSISLRLLSGTLLISSAFALATTSAQLFTEYGTDQAEFDNIFDQIEQSHVGAISGAIRSADATQIEVSLQGILGFPDITYVRITESGKETFAKGSMTTESSRIESYPLGIEVDGKMHEVGTLEVQASTSRAWSRVRSRIGPVLVSQTIKAFSISSLILLFISFLVGRRLNTLSQFFQTYDPATKSGRGFPKTKQIGRHVDDIDVMSTAIDQMVTNLDDLHTNLDAKIQQRTHDLFRKTQDMESILSNISQGVFSIDETSSIPPEYSKAMAMIFETDDIAGQDAFEFLFANSETSTLEVARNRMAVEMSIGSELLGFEVNRNSLTKEFVRSFSDERSKILETDWEPILDENNFVEKILVTIRDITDLRAAEEMAARNDEEMRLLVTMINVGAEVFQRFSDNSYSYILQAIAALNGSEKFAVQESTIMRNLHTMKGNSQTLGFNELAQSIHDVEEIFRSYSGKEIDQGILHKMNNGLFALHNIIRSYENLFHQKLKPMQGQEQTIETFPRHISTLDFSSIETIEETKEALLRHYVEMTSKPLDATIRSIIENLRVLCKELDREPISVVIEDKDEIRIRDSFAMHLADALNHCVRNSVDHGIEPRDEREASGKAPYGTIHLGIVKNVTGDDPSFGAKLEIKDDGRGLDMVALRAQAKSRSIEADAPDEDVANLIFSPGISTKGTVTEVSGRGIGLDAVRSFLLDKGCEVEIKLTGGQEGDHFRQFSFEMLVPMTKIFLKEQWWTSESSIGTDEKGESSAA